MRLGYRIGAILAVLGFAVWFGLPFGGELGQRFEAGAPTEVRLDADRSYMIWTTGTTPTCDLQPVAGSDATDVGLTYHRDPGSDLEANGGLWRGELVARVTPAGAYDLTCDTAGAIGDPPWGYSGRARALTVVTALGLVLAGAAVAVVTARRAPSAPSPATGPADPRTPRSAPEPPPS